MGATLLILFHAWSMLIGVSTARATMCPLPHSFNDFVVRRKVAVVVLCDKEVVNNSAVGVAVLVVLHVGRVVGDEPAIAIVHALRSGPGDLPAVGTWAVFVEGVVGRRAKQQCMTRTAKPTIVQDMK